MAIVALDEQERVILVRQHRQPAGAVLLEIPAGKLEVGEGPLACARREFGEETSLKAEDWQQLYVFYPSPGFSDEVIYLFRASGLSREERPGSDPDENLEVVKIPLDEAREKIEEGEIVDGKTIIAIQQLLLKRK